MSAASHNRRSYSKSYPLSLRYVQSSRESPIFSSPLQILSKSKPQPTVTTSAFPDSSTKPLEALYSKQSLKPSKQLPKKRVKLNCANPLPLQSTTRRHVKSPRPYKLMQTTAFEKAGATPRFMLAQRTLSFQKEDSSVKVLHAPSLKKKKSGRKVSELFVKSRTTVSDKSTRITDVTLQGGMIPSQVLDLTNNTGIGSNDELGSTDHSLSHQTVDRAEDLNRKLRNIFQGGNVVDYGQNVELDTSIAEENSDFKLKVFRTKQMLQPCRKREEVVPVN